MRVERVDTAQGPALYFHLNGQFAPVLLDGGESVERLAMGAVLSLWEGMRPQPPPYFGRGIKGWLSRRRWRKAMTEWGDQRGELIEDAIRSARELSV